MGLMRGPGLGPNNRVMGVFCLQKTTSTIIVGALSRVHICAHVSPHVCVHTSSQARAQAPVHQLGAPHLRRRWVGGHLKLGLRGLGGNLVNSACAHTCTCVHAYACAHVAGVGTCAVY